MIFPETRCTDSGQIQESPHFLYASSALRADFAVYQVTMTTSPMSRTHMSMHNPLSEAIVAQLGSGNEWVVALLYRDQNHFELPMLPKDPEPLSIP